MNIAKSRQRIAQLQAELRECYLSGQDASQVMRSLMSECAASGEPLVLPACRPTDRPTPESAAA